MKFNVKKRGKVSYYFEGDRPVLSALVTEEQADEFSFDIEWANISGGPQSIQAI